MQTSKKKHKRQVVTKGGFALAMILLLGGCSGNTNSMPEVFQVNTQASPAEGGTVTPPSRLVEQGTDLNVEAIPNDGWAFERWSGSIESEQNPMSVTIHTDMDLTATFRHIESVYRVSLSLTDDSGSLDELAFGQMKDPVSAGVPDAPPPPPGGVLSGWFERDGKRLFLDYRESLELSASWQMQVELGAGEQLDMSWAIESELLEGSLRMFGPDGSELADMLAGSTVQITLPGGKGVLTIEYELE